MVHLKLMAMAGALTLIAACADSDDANRSIGSRAAEPWPGVGSVTDSELQFHAHLRVRGTPDAPGSLDGSVSLVVSLQPTVHLTEADGQGGSWDTSISFRFPLAEVANVFDGAPLNLPVESGHSVIFYPRATSGQWVGRVLESLALQRLPNAQLQATIGLGATDEFALPTQGAAPVESATVSFTGPVVVTCSAYANKPEPFLVEDTWFESPFCQDFLARLAIGE